MRERSTRACQACRWRKVKCDGNGHLTCSQCLRLSLTCSYPETDPNSRLRRSTVRGCIIQACSEPVAPRSNTADDQPLLALSDVSQVGPLLQNFVFDTKFFLDLASDYSNYVLPTFPVISEPDFIGAIGRMNQSHEDCALVHSIAAATRIVVSYDSPTLEPHLDEATLLYTKALDARGHLLPSTHVTTYSIMTAAFVAKCLADIDHDSKSCYYYLRDAITRLQLLRVDDLHSQAQQTQNERQIRERAYWLLFIQERFDALNNFRPAILSPLPYYPEHDPQMPTIVHTGFIRLIELFRMVDTDFIRYRLNASGTSITLEWIRQKQAELGSGIEAWEDDISCLSNTQQVDLCVTRYWLRALVWQMSLQMLSVFPEGRGEEDYMSVLFPVRLSHKLRSLLFNMPRQAVEVHSTGILHKMFEITAISADILEHIIAGTDDPVQHSDHIDDFVFLSQFLLSMPRFKERGLLESRFQKVRTLFPWHFERDEVGAVT